MNFFLSSDKEKETVIVERNYFGSYEEKMTICDKWEKTFKRNAF